LSCTNCGAPDKRIYPALVPHPHLEDEQSQGWNSLKRCDKCNQLWCWVPYEPYASFHYLVSWPHSVEMWLSSAKEDEVNLFRWFDDQLRTSLHNDSYGT